MAFEGIPLNWEMLTLVGGACAATAGGSWKACQMLCRMQIKELEAKLGAYAHHAEIQSTDLANCKDIAERQKQRIYDQERLIEKLNADLDAGPISDEAINTIEELKKRIKNFDEL